MRDTNRSSQDVWRDVWLVGVDGCRAGWIAVFVRPDADEARIEIVPHFADIAAMQPGPGIIAVDMPIGLPDFSPPKGRAAEREVRRHLGSRQSSVFRIPSRRAVYFGAGNEPRDDRERFFAACAIARETSEDKKAFAKQGFYIFPKIVEVDEFLRANTAFVEHVYEIHPEVAFWRLNGDTELNEPKKKKNRPYEPGLALRRGLLIAAGMPAAIVESAPPGGAAPDDLLDALACAAIARRIHAGVAQPFPKSAPRDAYGLPMAIWA